MQPLQQMKRLAMAIAHSYQQQIAKEDHARLVAEFAALDVGQASKRHADPLEQIWKLPARRHRDRRRSNA